MLLAPVGCLAAPTSLNAVSQELARIQKQIERLKKTGRVRHATLIEVEKKTHRLDRRLTTLSSDMFNINKQMRAHKKRQHQLQSRHQDLLKTLERQRQQLASQLRIQYARGLQARTTAMLRA